MSESKIKDKIEEIENYLHELSYIIPSSFEEYTQNFEKKAACERYFERIIESVVDLAFLIIKEAGLKFPEEDKVTFEILAEEGLISRELALKLKEAKGMRNIISHQYGSVDDEIVFMAITEELVNDTNNFIHAVQKKRNLYKINPTK